MLCEMLTYPFGRRGPNGNGLSRPLSYRDNAGERKGGRERERERALFIKALTYYSIRLLLALFYSFAALSFFPSSTSVFYLPFYSYHISFSLRLSSATLTLLSFLLSASLHLFSPNESFCPSSFVRLFVLIHRVPFSLSLPCTDVFAIGDPNQSTILAVSIAGGIVLLIFLVTCFVVSGR